MFEFDLDDEVILTANADQRIYAGLFNRESYAKLNQRQFQFDFGSDSHTQTLKAVMSAADDYYAVVRYGRWNKGPAHVHVRVRRVRASTRT